MNNEVLNAANTRQSKLSTRGKIGLIPSLAFTFPFFISVLIFGVLIWGLAKVLKFAGILEAIQYQVEIAKRTTRNQNLKFKK
jgi:hypothetical protein